ncbi:MAG: tRNA (adenosine(37)-N6)-threonylcarbamoyltransferase complex dimerization subunit type 1 TsaB [Candidatus Omnitrophica bacterium]|nr:tRNA (adenosine(37)-N6)-threonylcarbamoyltransferase complex dimerization subunit type 1 TsaB [Candidatus Omnitrophota bacterium]
MKVLAFDSSDAYLTVAVCEDSQVLAETHRLGPRTHASVLAPTIQSTLKDLGLGIRELDAVAVGLGPGSFTGTRLGLATARGLAQAIERPLIGVGSLESVAQALGEECEYAAVLVNAGRDRIYVGRFRRDRTVWKPDAPYACVKEEELDIGAGAFYLSGSALATRADALRQRFAGKARVVEEGLWYPRARWVAQVGLRHWNSGQRQEFLDPMDPIYLHPDWPGCKAGEISPDPKYQEDDGQ